MALADARGVGFRCVPVSPHPPSSISVSYIPDMAHKDPVGDQLLAAFEAGAIGPADFPHERHVRVAWLCARAYGREVGLARLEAGIRRIACEAGRPEAFHVTITRAWFELIAAADELAEHEELFDKTLLGRYYSPGRLDAGRDCWVEPDLRPLRLPPPRPQPVDCAAADVA